jgi:hypothetical protein
MWFLGCVLLNWFCLHLLIMCLYCFKHQHHNQLIQRKRMKKREINRSSAKFGRIWILGYKWFCFFFKDVPLDLTLVGSQPSRWGVRVRGMSRSNGGQGGYPSVRRPRCRGPEDERGTTYGGRSGVVKRRKHWQSLACVHNVFTVQRAWQQILPQVFSTAKAALQPRAPWQSWCPESHWVILSSSRRSKLTGRTIGSRISLGWDGSMIIVIIYYSRLLIASQLHSTSFISETPS